MKKTILLLLLLSLSFTACKDDESKDAVSTESGVNQEVVLNDQATITDTNAPVTQGPTYRAYDATTAESWKGVKHILFFHADWCPKCQALDKDISENLSTLPASTAIVKVNYDDSEDLKKKYGIIAQDTLVLIDASGSVVSLKMGAGLEDIKTFFAN